MLYEGIDDHGSLVAVEDAPRGKTDLHCPYCVGPLTAKKGQVSSTTLHTLATRAERWIALGTRSGCRCTISFTSPDRRFALLWNLWAAYGDDMVSIPAASRSLRHRLEARGVLAWNRYRGRRGGYEITKLGKIPLGALSLRLFTEIQEPLLHEKHVELEQAAQDARTRPQTVLDQALTDLRIYRAQWRRILSTTLYFLEVQVAGETLYKIGVTQRAVDDRVAEIAQELRAVAGDVTIRVLESWPQRGNVELYFTAFFTVIDP